MFNNTRNYNNNSLYFQRGTHLANYRLIFHEALRVYGRSIKIVDIFEKNKTKKNKQTKNKKKQQLQLISHHNLGLNKPIVHNFGSYKVSTLLHVYGMNGRYLKIDVHLYPTSYFFTV